MCPPRKWNALARPLDRLRTRATHNGDGREIKTYRHGSRNTTKDAAIKARQKHGSRRQSADFRQHAMDNKKPAEPMAPCGFWGTATARYGADCLALFER